MVGDFVKGNDARPKKGGPFNHLPSFLITGSVESVYELIAPCYKVIVLTYQLHIIEIAASRVCTHTTKTNTWGPIKSYLE